MKKIRKKNQDNFIQLRLERSFARNPRFSVVRLRIELRDTISNGGGFSRESGYTLKKGGGGGLEESSFRVSIVFGTKGANGSNGGDGTSRSPLFRFRIARKTSPLKNSTFSESHSRPEWIELQEEEEEEERYTSIYLLARLEFSCFLAIKDYRAFIYLFLLTRCQILRTSIKKFLTNFWIFFSS